MSDLEVHNLPLVARNPYNFALVQPGVTGIENVEFGVPRLAANGAAMRINYMIDGNTNTEKDRAGLRLLPMSEVMIQEVKVVTTGFAPEFGQTMGMVYNAVTPSGTNTFKGEGSYLFRRNPFSAFPFFTGCTGVASTCGDAPAGSVLPATKVDTGTVRRRRTGDQEQGVLLRRLGADAPRPVVDQPGHDHRRPTPRRSAWRRSRRSSPTCRPASSSSLKGDMQLNGANRATVRWIASTTTRPTTAAAASRRSSRRPTSSTRWIRSPASWCRRSAPAS